MNTAVRRLVRTELTLMKRDPLTLTFVFAFPVLTMIIIGGSFGTGWWRGCRHPPLVSALNATGRRPCPGRCNLQEDPRASASLAPTP